MKITARRIVLLQNAIDDLKEDPTNWWNKSTYGNWKDQRPIEQLQEMVDEMDKEFVFGAANPYLQKKELIN